MKHEVTRKKNRKICVICGFIFFNHCNHLLFPVQYNIELPEIRVTDE